MVNKYRYGEEYAQKMAGQPLQFPGTPEGYPVRGPQVNLRPGEMDELETTVDFHSALFDLSDPEKKAEYDRIYDHICDRHYILYRRLEKWEETSHPIVWLEWGEIHVQIPPAVANSARW